MTARIWPGALCYITHPTMFGRMVEALHEAPVGVEYFRLPDGYRNIGAPFAGVWVCKFLGQSVTVPCERGERETQYACIPARWLRPITPPPGSESTEDRAPVGEIVGV
jgi:hypothetical protein